MPNFENLPGVSQGYQTVRTKEQDLFMDIVISVSEEFLVVVYNLGNGHLRKHDEVNAVLDGEIEHERYACWLRRVGCCPKRKGTEGAHQHLMVGL